MKHGIFIEIRQTVIWVGWLGLKDNGLFRYPWQHWDGCHPLYAHMDKPTRTLVPACCKGVNPILHGLF